MSVCVSVSMCVCSVWVYLWFCPCFHQAPRLLSPGSGSIVIQSSCPLGMLGTPQTSIGLVRILVRGLVFESLLLSSVVPIEAAGSDGISNFSSYSRSEKSHFRFWFQELNTVLQNTFPLFPAGVDLMPRTWQH